MEPRDSAFELKIRDSLAEHAALLASVGDSVGIVRDVANLLRGTIRAGGTVFVCGNGGSASDAQHFAAELTGRYVRDRRGYPAIALTTDTSALTAIGNDYGFDHIFSRQLEALARPGDLLLAISTSGNSSNVVRAVKQARNTGLKTVGLLGRDGGKLKDFVDIALVVESQRTARIQEMHIFILHMLCEAFETDD